MPITDTIQGSVYVVAYQDNIFGPSLSLVLDQHTNTHRYPGEYNDDDNLHEGDAGLLVSPALHIDEHVEWHKTQGQHRRQHCHADAAHKERK